MTYRGTVRIIMVIAFLCMSAWYALAQGWNFKEEFNGVFNHIWLSSPGSLPTEAMPLYQQNVSHLGAVPYSFTSVAGADGIQLNTLNAPHWSRFGYISQASMSGSSGVLEARINTLTQSDPNIDGLFDLWLVNSADHSQFVRVGFFSDNFSTLFSWTFASSQEPYQIVPFAYQSNTWYRIRIRQVPGLNLEVSVWDDAGTTRLVSHTFGHTLQALGSQFQVGFSQWMGGPDRTHHMLSMVDYIRAAPSPAPVDLNSDSKPDILWQNNATGDVTYWLMNGVQIASFGSIASAIPLDWRIVGTAEINGDGKPDFIWHNRTTGDVTYWLMNGPMLLSYGTIARGVSTDWEIAAAPDLNGDNQFDLLWRNRSTGAVSYWIMNGATASRYGIILPSSDTNWQIVATLDINYDGHTDILWQHRTTGEVVYWVMNGVNKVSHATLAAGVALEWKVAGRMDLNGDGKMDLLWRNQTTGAVSYWLLNGTTILRWGIIRNSVPLEWQIVGLR